MSKQQTVTGFVTLVQRAGHTVYGNPIKVAHIDDEPYRIGDNASLVYEIENPEYRSSLHTFALTRAGRISHVIR